jgi:RND family efflux transporter MFP subunit
MIKYSKIRFLIPLRFIPNEVRNLTVISCILLLIGCSGNKKEEKQPQKELAKVEFKTDNTPEVVVMTLKEIPFRRQLVSNGRVRAKEKSAIAFKTSGIVESIHVSNGVYVRAGDVLAVLNTEDAENALRSAQLNFARAEIDLNNRIIGMGFTGIHDTVPEKTMELAKLNSGFKVSELNLENAQRNVEACTLRAPFSGKVANLNRRVYEKTSGDFCSVINDARLIIDFTVLETELDFVRKGARVKVSSFFEPEKYINGMIVSVNPTVNDRGQVTVEAEIANNGSYIDGMNIRIYVESEMPGQLVVPKSAVVLRDNLEVLFRYSKNRSKWTYVHTLRENSEEYVVTANTSRGADLSAGDTVIISGNLNLAHETVVKTTGK